MDRRAFVLAIAAVPAAALAAAKAAPTHYYLGALEAIEPPAGLAYSAAPYLKAANRELIAKLYGVPPELIAPADTSTYGAHLAELEARWRQLLVGYGRVTR